MAALSYKRLAAEKGNKRLEEAFENHEVLKEKVAQVLENGRFKRLGNPVYSFRQAWYPTHTRRIYPSMQTRRSNS